MAEQAPASQPPSKEEQIASMRQAEQDAMRILKEKPVADEVVPESQEDIELLAALAGSTAATLKQARFQDNVMAPTASRVLDPRAVIGQLIKRNPGNQPPPTVRQPVPPTVLKLGTPVVTPNPNDPQLELELFKKMDMTDVYNILSELKQEVKDLKTAFKDVKEVLDLIRNA